MSFQASILLYDALLCSFRASSASALLSRFLFFWTRSIAFLVLSSICSCIASFSSCVFASAFFCHSSSISAIFAASSFVFRASSAFIFAVASCSDLLCNSSSISIRSSLVTQYLSGSSRTFWSSSVLTSFMLISWVLFSNSHSFTSQSSSRMLFGLGLSISFCIDSGVTSSHLSSSFAVASSVCASSRVCFNASIVSASFIASLECSFGSIADACFITSFSSGVNSEPHPLGGVLSSGPFGSSGVVGSSGSVPLFLSLFSAISFAFLSIRISATSSIIWLNSFSVFAFASAVSSSILALIFALYEFFTSGSSFKLFTNVSFCASSLIRSFHWLWIVHFT